MKNEKNPTLIQRLETMLQEKQIIDYTIEYDTTKNSLNKPIPLICILKDTVPTWLGLSEFNEATKTT